MMASESPNCLNCFKICGNGAERGGIMKINVMSDIVPPESEKNLFTEGKIEELVEDSLRKKIAEADFNIVNLECPLTKSENPMKKWGSSIKAAPECVNLLKRIPNLVVNLANNHIRDYGDSGLLETIHILEENQIAYVGAGKNRASLVKSVILSGKEARAAVYACAEHEFSIAGEKNAGANPFALEDMIFELQHLSQENDFLIVLYHGGVEFYPYPTPQMRKNLQALVKAGADLVICQHNHCISAVEETDKGKIVYGQGSFLFSDRTEVENNIADFEMWESGMMVEVLLPERRINYCCFVRENGKIKPDLSGKKQKLLMKQSQNMLQEGFIEESWKKYCSSHLEYMGIFRKKFQYEKRGLKEKIKEIAKILLNREDDSDSEYLRIYDYVYCESHIELIRRICQIKSDFDQDMVGKGND